MRPWQVCFYLCRNGRIQALAVGEEPARNNYPSDQEVEDMTGWPVAQLRLFAAMTNVEFGRVVVSVRYHRLRSDIVAAKNGKSDD